MLVSRYVPTMNAGDELWYSQPLSVDDVLAGGVLLVFGLASLGLYSLVAYIIFKNDQEIVGFRFLFSAAIADMLLLFNYAIWPSMTILFKSEILPKWTRHWIQFYLDWVWFAMVQHYLLIAWSRFAAIRWPASFRVQSRRLSYSLCFGVYVSALIQVCLTHWQPFYVLFYFEPSHYGMLCEDFEKYLNDGQSLFFATFHCIFVLLPTLFYVWALLLLLKHRRSGVLFQKTSKAGGVKTKASQSRTETRLLVPCALNTIIFVIGQVVITIGTGEGKWATWTVLLLFTANSAVNPVLLLCFSTLIREKAMALFNPKKLLQRPETTQTQGGTITTAAFKQRDSPSTQTQVVGLEPMVTPELLAYLDERNMRAVEPRFQSYV
ncbi:hypothetical protein M3Y99_01442300 [Aphelenchoides fujianensis]|nr:hypothetical protein M3Y99_01442300 [Aphelenchoides fujianensis]